MMATKRAFRLLLISLTIIVNIGCDQVSKKIVRKNIAPYETIEVVKDHLTLTNVENSGAFLSLGTGLTGNTRSIVLSILPLLAMLAGLAFLIMNRQLPPFLIFAFSLIIGGGLGNVADRIVYGSVTDFLHIDFGIFQTGIFNMADVSIMAGCALILCHSLIKKFSKRDSLS
jgi:signal peptidase II